MHRLAAVVLALALVAAGIGIGGIVVARRGDSSPTVISPRSQPAVTGPDMIVGAVLNCALYSPTRGRIDFSGEVCNGKDYLSRRYHLTIRRPDGSTYEADTDATSSIHVGDTWPSP